jgi:hypothetical protein
MLNDNNQRLLVIVAALFGFCWLILCPSPVFAIQNITSTTIDSNATVNATFQSTNQKVLQNQYGIFITYLHSYQVIDNSESNTWRLARSQDGGQTFTTIFESTNNTRAPVIETDSNGTIYLIRNGDEGGTQDSYLYRFTPANNFSNPTITKIPGAPCDKCAMVIDEARSQLYYFQQLGNFTVVGLDGTVKANYKVVKDGTSPLALSQFNDQTTLEYPLLYLDNGTLYAAWTSQLVHIYLYWDIHFMLSKDGGVTWQKPNGTVLSIPVAADESGPTDRITLDDEFTVHTWLSTFLVKNGKAHFVYQAQTTPPREHYVRYDLATARIDKNFYPDFGGETIKFNYLDGFCASRADITEIYCMSKDANDKIGVVYSSDNGDTWHDYAQSASGTNGAYSIGGSRSITSDGYIIGTYTQSWLSPPTVQFFKIKIGAQFAPSVDNVTINSANVKADGSTQYTITVSGSDPHGAADLTQMFAYINSMGENAGHNRGKIDWGIGDYWPTSQDHTTCNKVGGGNGGYASIEVGSGGQYLNLISCSISDSGNSRIVSFAVHFNSNFTSPTIDNDIAGYVWSGFALSDPRGWVNFDTNFNLATISTPTPTPTLTLTPTPTPSISPTPTPSATPTSTPTPTQTPAPTGPIISNIYVNNLTPFAASINWNTDEPADGQVEFCASFTHCGFNTPLVSQLITSHAINLSGLVPNTNYYYWIKSADSNGNMTTSVAQTFRTLISTPTPTPTPTPSQTPTPSSTPTPTPPLDTNPPSAPTGLVVG